MSTVVDNDKYIINGSTLSEIGDALTQYLGPGTVHYQESYIYYIADGGYGNQTITFNDNYFGITGVQKIKFILTEITGANLQAGKVYSSGRSAQSFASNTQINQEYIFTLPAYWQGQTWTSQGMTRSAGGNFKVFPLDANENVLIPDSATISSKNYQSEAITTEVIQPRTVSDIAQSITEMATLPPSADSLQVDFSLVATRGYNTAPSTNLSTIGVSDISDIYFIIGYESYNSSNSGLVFLDLVHNPNPVGTTTLGNEVCPTYKVYRIPKHNSNSGNAYAKYASEPSVYKTIAYSKQQNMLYNPSSSSWNGLTKNNNNYTEYMMVIHKPTSSS